MKTGEAGRDLRGLWIRDDDTGTHLRLGEVGHEMAATFAGQDNTRLTREAMSKPRVGLWFEKTF